MHIVARLSNDVLALVMAHVEYFGAIDLHNEVAILQPSIVSNRVEYDLWKQHQVCIFRV